MVDEFGSSAQSYGQTAPVQQSRPPQNRPMQYNYPPSRGYMALIIVGIIILLLGGIIYSCVGFLGSPDSSDDKYQNDSDAYTKDLKAYRDNMRLIPTFGAIIEYIGTIILSIGLIIGAIKDESLAQNVRLGMLIAMGLIVAFKIGGYFFPYYSYLTYS